MLSPTPCRPSDDMKIIAPEPDGVLQRRRSFRIFVCIGSKKAQNFYQFSPSSAIFVLLTPKCSSGRGLVVVGISD